MEKSVWGGGWVEIENKCVGRKAKKKQNKTGKDRKKQMGEFTNLLIPTQD